MRERTVSSGRRVLGLAAISLVIVSLASLPAKTSSPGRQNPQDLPKASVPVTAPPDLPRTFAPDVHEGDSSSLTTSPSNLPTSSATGLQTTSDLTDLSTLLREKGSDLLRRGKSEDAAAAYAEVLAKDPADALSMEGRIRALIASGRWQEALDEARRFSKNEPLAGRSGFDLARIRTALGEALYRAGLIAEAGKVLEDIIEPAKGRAPRAAVGIASSEAPPARALLALALVRVAEGRDAEAETLFSRALTTDPSDRDIVFWAAGAVSTRARAVELLERYLSMSEGDDPDRIEGARGSIRLYKALGEKSVWVASSRPSSLEVPLSPLADRNGRVTGFVIGIAAGTGKPIRVLLDTGSTGLFLLERIALKAGFAPLSEETTFGGGGSGRQASKRGLIPSVSVGGLSFRDALVSTTTEEIEPTGRYHGLLGMSFFDGYRATLDLGRGRLVLESSKDGTPTAASGGSQRSHGAISTSDGSSRNHQASSACEGSSGSHQAISTSDRSPQLRQEGTVTLPPGLPGTPYWTVSSQMLVEAATSDGRSGLFLFDTGASTSLLSLDFAARGQGSGLGGATTIRGYGGPIREARKVAGLRLRFQGLESPEPSMNAADLRQRSRLGGVEISGFLGLDLLNRTRIRIDTDGRRIFVDKPGRK